MLYTCIIIHVYRECKSIMETGRGVEEVMVTGEGGRGGEEKERSESVEMVEEEEDEEVMYLVSVWRV